MSKSVSKSPFRIAVATITAIASSTAQAAPPQIMGASNPPSRVGDLWHIAGSVSTHALQEDSWRAAAQNMPVTSGDSLWTEPGARANIGIVGDQLAMAGGTEIDIATLDDRTLALTEPQGEILLHLRQGQARTIVSIPHGAVDIESTGRFEISAGDADHPATITAEGGAAMFTPLDSAGNALAAVQIADGSTVIVQNDGQVSSGPIRHDAFFAEIIAHYREQHSAHVSPAIASMSGGTLLEEYGDWQETPDYGTVWYPPVQAGWAPYHAGHWAYVSPWGWTWIDDAPWGFAPSHYGRWARFDGRWGWIPVSSQTFGTPVYAPALVSFVAPPDGAVGSDPMVGWFPLGPGEIYHPPYRVSHDYLREMNGPDLRVGVSFDTAEHEHHAEVGGLFANQNAAIMVSAAVMAGSIGVAAVARPIVHAASMRTQVAPPVTPRATTVGVTPSVARQFGFSQAKPMQATAPGPRIEAGSPMFRTHIGIPSPVVPRTASGSRADTAKRAFPNIGSAPGATPHAYPNEQGFNPQIFAPKEAAHQDEVHQVHQVPHEAAHLAEPSAQPTHAHIVTVPAQTTGPHQVTHAMEHEPAHTAQPHAPIFVQPEHSAPVFHAPFAQQSQPRPAPASMRPEFHAPVAPPPMQAARPQPQMHVASPHARPAEPTGRDPRLPH